MYTEIYLVRQEVRCRFLDNTDYSFILFERAFYKKNDAELYLYQLKQDLFNAGCSSYNDLDDALFGDSKSITSFFKLRDRFVKLSIKKIFLT